MSYSVLIPCGPSPREVIRIRDILESLARHEPDYELLVVVNDGNQGLGFLDEWPRTVVIPGPRDNRGWGVGGGLVFNQLAGYSHIAGTATRSRFVLRLDTDAWILGPFAERVEAVLAAERSIGMIGSFVDSDQLGPDRRTPGISYFAGKAKKLQQPVALWKKPRFHLTTLLNSSHRTLREYFRKAKKNGYQDGYLVEGGAFAFSFTWLELAETTGLFDQASSFLHAPVTEDLIMTMLTYRLGLRAINSPLFCIEPSGLRYPAEKMISLARHSPITHSVKHPDEEIERQIRNQLRSAR